MRLFGLDITVARAKAATAVTPIPASAGMGYGWFGTIYESFAGAWQRNIVVESTQNILAFSAVYACIALIAGDIAKLRLKLMTRDAEARIWNEDETGLPVFDRPNRYQTLPQFLENWVSSKLLHGNAYILLERSSNAAERAPVDAMYVLDPRTVTPLVAADGDVYYQLGNDDLAGVSELNEGIAKYSNRFVVPASEIIHDRAVALWHPLCGVSPIYACAASATQGIRIQNNSEAFFKNMSRPSGQLTSPGKISKETADSLKKQFEEAFGGSALGRMWVSGDGLKYEPMTIPAQDAQLIEQLKWTVEDVARCFRVPLHMLAMSGQGPTYANAESYLLLYYSQTLQTLIEGVEKLLDRSLKLPRTMKTEFDLDGLLRMDTVSRAEANAKAIQAGYLAPNEARRRENLPPVVGGDSPYLQQQNWSLDQLADRTPPADAPASPARARGTWSRDIVYGSGDIVLHAGKRWQGRSGSRGHTPGESATWEHVG